MMSHILPIYHLLQQASGSVFTLHVLSQSGGAGPKSACLLALAHTVYLLYNQCMLCVSFRYGHYTSDSAQLDEHVCAEPAINLNVIKVLGLCGMC